jgi:hypothetical protein
MEYIVVLVTPYFRFLAGAPRVHWRAGAVASVLEQGPIVVKGETLRTYLFAKA